MYMNLLVMEKKSAFRFYAIVRSLLVLLLLQQWCYGQSVMSLSGSWQFRTDAASEGLAQQWYTQIFPGTIELPGSMLENKKGDPVTLQTKWTGSIYDSSWYFNPRFEKYRQPGNLKFPFWLTPATYYVGAAWYQKEVTIPQGWRGKHITLFLERAHTDTYVWVDNTAYGTCNSFVAPHTFDVTAGLTPGIHTITVMVDNRIKDINVGPDSHSLTDHTQGNWNGIVGKMELRATAPVWCSDVQVYPDVSAKKALVKLVLAGKVGSTGHISLLAESFNSKTVHRVMPVQAVFRLERPVDTINLSLLMGKGMLTWDEFDPALYRLKVIVSAADGQTDEKQTQFGMRSFTTKGTRFEVNGRPVFLRGTVENCVFPLTGYAPMDVASWKRVFEVARSYGLNHMRFHSYCPPEAAFNAADQLGFYLQPEGPSWANHGSSLGDGKPIDQFIYDETNRMAKAYGNHPSFCMLAYGNEPKGGKQAAYLSRFVQYWMAKDSRRVYTGASVAMSWPLVPGNQFMIKSGPRGLSWRNSMPESQSDYRAAIEKFDVPYLAHEMGQWCVFPDFEEIGQYTGVYKAKNFELFRDDLVENGMGDQARDFLRSSGKLQLLCYKHEIEKALRTPGFAGFQLLSLNDYPGQGTALVGVLNPFWKEKGYADATSFSRFCNATVPLIRTEKFVYKNNEVLNAAIELSHFGKAPLHNVTVRWTLTVGDPGGKVAAVIGLGRFTRKEVPIGNCIPIGEISQLLHGVIKAQKLKLRVEILNTTIRNEWEIWVYPPLPATPAKDSIYYCTSFDEQAVAVLQKGGNVFLDASGKVVKGKEVVQQFTPVFWNTSWFKMRPPHTLGITVNPEHPVFAAFPTESYGNFEWWEILQKAQVMHLEDFPLAFKPLVQPIDTWFMNRRLAFLFEAKVYKGKLMVSSANLSPNTGEDKPAARQLMYSVQQYMLSDQFKPAFTVKAEVIKDLFTKPSRRVFDAFTKDSPDELKPKPANQ
jgi:hypothetical protein